MSANALVYGWLPAIVVVISLAGSALVSWKARSFFHGFLTATVLACAFWSLLMLYRVFVLEERLVHVMTFFGRGRNYLPHLTTLAAFIVFALQSFHLLSRFNSQKKR